MFIAIQYKSDLLESFGALDASDNSLSVGNANDACDKDVIDNSTKNITASNALIFFLSFLNGGVLPLLQTNYALSINAFNSFAFFSMSSEVGN